MLTRARSHLISITIISIVIALIYGQTHNFEFVEYDDTAYITENEYIAQGLSSESIHWAFTYKDLGRAVQHTGIYNLWHPLTWVSHMLDVEIFGLDHPGSHHLANVILYLAGAIFTFLCFEHISKSPITALIATLLFITHPLKVESVAWVSERKDLLSGFFFWSALWTLLKSWACKKHSLWWSLSTLLFLGGLLSKPSIVILPVIAILLKGYMDRESQWGLSFLKRGIRENFIWLGLSFAGAATAIYFQSAGSHSFFADSSSLIGRLITSGAGLLFYLYRVLIPINLSFEYPYPKIPMLLWGLAWFVVLASAFIVWSSRKRYPSLFFAAVWFALCWLPVSGLVYVGTSFTCDRYLYIAIAGPFLALVSWISTQPKQRKIIGLVTLSSFIISWSVLSWNQTKAWKNSASLFQHAVKAQPKAALNWTNLAALTQLNGEPEKAISLHKKALELSPKDYISAYNIGLCYQHLEKNDLAKEYFEQALENYPHYLPALRKLADIHIQRKELQQAASLLSQACELNKFRSIQDLWTLSKIEFNLGNMQKAQETLNILTQHKNLPPELSTEAQRMNAAILQR